MVPHDLRYHKEHEWVRVEGGKGIVGITDYAQGALGDIVYIGLPEVGREVKAGQEVTEIESTKATSVIYTPVGGRIVEVNQKASDAPEMINDDPYGEGWIFTVELSDPSDLDRLMDALQYEAYIQGLK